MQDVILSTTSYGNNLNENGLNKAINKKKG